MIYLLISKLAGDTDGYFQLNTATGEILLQKAFDFETMSSTTLKPVIKAIDSESPARTASTTLTVSVTDDSDTVPTCTSSAYSSSVDEDASTGTTVGGGTVISQ